MTSTEKTIAVFDFDHTLIKSDSFLPFLGYVAGWPRTTLALVKSFFLLAVSAWQGPHDDEAGDARTFIKAQLLKNLLAGQRTSRLAPAIKKLRRWQQPNPDIRQALLDHHAAGHHIVIASGGLDLYLPELLKDFPHHALICTQVEIKGGAITGVMPAGNCVRQRKAELLAEYLETHGPYDDSWGYGNLPHDLPMLELLQKRILV